MKNFPYPITIRILNGWIEVAAVDFKIVKAKKRFEDIRIADEIGMLVLEVIKDSQTKMDVLRFEKRSIPSPSKPRGAFESEQDLSDPLLSTREVQELLQVSHETVRRLSNSGELPTIKTHGGHRRFRMSDVENYLKSR